MVARFERKNAPVQLANATRLLHAALHTVRGDCQQLRDSPLALRKFYQVSEQEFISCRSLLEQTEDGHLAARCALVTHLSSPTLFNQPNHLILPLPGHLLVSFRPCEISLLLPDVIIGHNALEHRGKRLTNHPYDFLLMLAELHADYVRYGKEGVCGFDFDAQGWTFTFANAIHHRARVPYRAQHEGRAIVTNLARNMGARILKYGPRDENSWEFRARFAYPTDAAKPVT